MKIGKLSSFESKFVKRLRELTVGMDDEYLAWWQDLAMESFEEWRPYSLEEEEKERQSAISMRMSNYQCMEGEVLLAWKEGREPRPRWETDPEWAANNPDAVGDSFFTDREK